LFYPVITSDMVAEFLAGAHRAGLPDSLWKLTAAAFTVEPSSIEPEALAALQRPVAPRTDHERKRFEPT
jgi:hypothetical protein